MAINLIEELLDQSDKVHAKADRLLNLVEAGDMQLLETVEDMTESAACLTDMAEQLANNAEAGYDPYNSHARMMPGFCI